MLIVLAALLVSFAAVVDTQQPPSCDCLDWYGICKSRGSSWTDDATWFYTCDSTGSAPATFAGCQLPPSSTVNRIVPVAANETYAGFWYSCQANAIRARFEQEPHCVVNGTRRRVGSTFRDGRFHWLCLETGRWVTGCYFANETGHPVLVKISQIMDDGLVRHSCQRRADYPGRIQYLAEIRPGAHVKQFANRPRNGHLFESGDFRPADGPKGWLRETTASFVANEADLRVKIRYLEKSRRRWAPVAPIV